MSEPTPIRKNLRTDNERTELINELKAAALGRIEAINRFTVVCNEIHDKCHTLDEYEDMRALVRTWLDANHPLIPRKPGKLGKLTVVSVEIKHE